MVAVMTLTPGTLMRRRTSSAPLASIAIARSSGVDLAGEEVDLSQAGVDRIALVAWELEGSQPGAVGFAEQVAHGRLTYEIADQHGVDFVFLEWVRERTSCDR